MKSMKDIEKLIMNILTNPKVRFFGGVLFLLSAFIVTLLKKDKEIPFIYNQF